MEEQPKVSHSHRNVTYAADSLWKIWADLQDVSLRGAEDGYRAVRFFGIVVQVRVVLRIVIMESEAHVAYR